MRLVADVVGDLYLPPRRDDRRLSGRQRRVLEDLLLGRGAGQQLSITSSRLRYFRTHPRA